MPATHVDYLSLPVLFEQRQSSFCLTWSLLTGLPLGLAPALRVALPLPEWVAFASLSPAPWIPGSLVGTATAESSC